MLSGKVLSRSQGFAVEPGTATFTSAGTFTVPQGIGTLQVDVRGASGDDGVQRSGDSSVAGSGGNGNRVVGTVTVTPGQQFDVLFVAGMPGGRTNGSFPSGGAGGRGARLEWDGGFIVAGGGGGGGGNGFDDDDQQIPDDAGDGGNGGTGDNSLGQAGTDGWGSTDQLPHAEGGSPTGGNADGSGAAVVDLGVSANSAGGGGGRGGGSTRAGGGAGEEQPNGGNSTNYSGAGGAGGPSGPRIASGMTVTSATTVTGSGSVTISWGDL